jgi:hypothetical protein
LDQPDYIVERRHALRKKAGLRDKDGMVSWWPKKSKNIYLHMITKNLDARFCIELCPISITISEVPPFTFVDRLVKGDVIREVEVFCLN